GWRAGSASGKRSSSPERGARMSPGAAADRSEPRELRGEFAVLGTLLPYLRPYSLRISLALAMILLAKLFLLLVPVVLKRIVDQLALKPSLVLVPAALLLSYGAARIGNTLFTELRQVVFAPVMARVSRRVAVGGVGAPHSPLPRFPFGRPTGGMARHGGPGGGAVADLLGFTIFSILPAAIEGGLVPAVLVWAY